MPIMAKGANTPLPGGLLRVAVVREAEPGDPPVAAAVVLLDGAGRVRGEADVVPGPGPRTPRAPCGTRAGLWRTGPVVHRLEVDERAVEAAVQRVLIAVLTAGGPFGAVGGLSVEVADTAGRTVRGTRSRTPAGRPH
ncbi:hypothetical protein [Streptomyces sp. NPDC093089]|uniref:hypothetical protein n=1 Tax=Streptomyces sp. NPDC093089 TaxID=3366024 RepID=UPI00382DA1FB